jgi:hypothetical protein
MGGNALSQGSIRVDLDVYTRVKNSLLHTLPVFRKDVPLSYESKINFGDIDVVHAGFTVDYETLCSRLKELYGATEIVRNGPCISFDFHDPRLGVQHGGGNGVQVDLIKVPSESFDFSLRYYSYNDLGCLIGTIARRCGFKFGHEGLFYRYNHSDKNNISFVPVTTDYYQALSLLGFETTQKFKTVEEIFEYIVRSKYFNPETFQLNMLNSVNRVRNSKRPVYMHFLDWISRSQVKPGMEINKESLLKEVMKEVVGFENNLKGTMQNLFVKEKVKEVFNGKIVSEWTGEQGRHLGCLMAAIKDSYESDLLLNIDALYYPDRLKANVIHIAASL